MPSRKLLRIILLAAAAFVVLAILVWPKGKVGHPADDTAGQGDGILAATDAGEQTWPDGGTAEDYLVPRRFKRPAVPAKPSGGTGSTTTWRGTYGIPTDLKEVVLTLDDGPTIYTREILSILQEHDVKAAFFWIASYQEPSFVSDLLQEGHQVGSHTLNHPNLTHLDAAQLRRELEGAHNVLVDWTGGTISYMRPPYGAYDQRVSQLAAELGEQVILWNVDSRDWALKDNPEQILTNIMNQVKNGSIILMHERPQTVQMLPRIIRALRAEGYTFRLLPEAP